MTRPGRPWYRWQEQLTEAINCFMLSLKFGWTPDEIKGLEDEERDRYIMLLKGMGMAKED